MKTSNSQPCAVDNLGIAHKIGLLVLLSVLVGLPYFLSQQFPFFAPADIPQLVIDRWTPYVPAASYVYLSLYALLALPVFFHDTWRELKTGIFGFAWIVFVSHVVFVVFPTQIPERIAGASDWGVHLIQATDTRLNACPSLHASLAIYCTLLLGRLLRHRAKIAIWIWTISVLVSTLLVKQHVLLDLVAGGFLGAACFWALFRPLHEEDPASPAEDATIHARIESSQGLGPQLEELRVLSWKKRVKEYLFFGAVECLGLWLVVQNHDQPGVGKWLLACGVVLSALALNAFVLLMHDGMHGTLARDPRWNRLTSILLGSTFLMSFSAYRLMHTRHHVYLGEKRDPDDYNNYLGNRGMVWSMHFVRLTIGSLLYLLVIPIQALKFGTEQERKSILFEYGFLVLLYSIVFRCVALDLLFHAWFLPLLIVGVMTSIRGLTQHGITDAHDPYIASRTITPHPLVRLFLLNENYHLEHHFFPEVPSYHLHALHQLIWQRLPRVVSGKGYGEFLFRFFKATPRMDNNPIGLENRAALEGMRDR